MADDAATILEYFINDVANLPAEVHHLFEELQAKDKQLAECRNAITQRDNAIQKFIRQNGSHVPYPKEEQYAAAIRKHYQIAMRLQDEKLALAQKALALVDRHNRRLLSKIRTLQSEGMLPSDSAQPATSNAANGLKSSSSHTRNPSRASPAVPSRLTPAPSAAHHTPAPSAHASPHPGTSNEHKRRKLLGSQPPSGLQRSGTPNANQQTPVSFGRAALGTKRYAQKGVPRHKKKRVEHEGGSADEDEEMDSEDEEGGEDKRLYCFCKQVSWGNMVGCDNPDCEYEWFHWGCVGITKEPAGAWFCDECRKKLGK